MPPIEVLFLGSGDAFGSGGRFQTCISVRTGGFHLLLDCGSSSLIAMRKVGVDPNSIDVILLSHLHGDHFGGIPFFVLDAQLISKRTKPLTVVGPAGVEARVKDTMEALFPGSSRTGQRFALEFVELGASAAIGPVTVTPFEVVHASGAPPYALRVAWGDKVISYSGDTEWTDSLLRAAEGADLFICEAYFYEKKVRYHLDYKTLAAHELGCRRLIVTHMSEDMLGRLDGLEVEWAEDGKRLFV